MEKVEVAILCGGRGGRLMPLTDELPKPMVYLKQQPMLKHILDIFSNWGFRKFFLCVGYKGFMIRDYFTGKSLPYDIEFDDLGENATMLERVQSIAKRITGPRFLLGYGDALADINLGALLKYHQERNSLLTMSAMRIRSPFGILKTRPDGQAYSFEEKPILRDWVNIGFMVLEKSIFVEIPEEWTIVDLYQSLVAQGRLFVYKHSGKHLTVNTKDDKLESEEQLDGFYTVLNQLVEEKNGK
ncbi:MAG: nucleotidyl transferase [uncultured bacterium]|nr:MAG: nucleotidyl transferase [uncultured bacterium]